IGVTARVIPGILPITSYEGLLKFTSLNGSSIPQNIKNIFEPIKDNKEKIILEGIKFAISQCKELLHNGAPGLHFYTLNKLNPTKEILRSIR
ncbi:MAG TPA: methylenetetrahydrofolate reductase, partial [Candidatus Omnitrophota bacterium]|nr:methylenetetrahydrofolate reductase [Candidatus Omnitrophota bacterium]